MRSQRRHDAQARSLHAGSQVRRGARAHSARDAGRNAAPVLFHQDRMWYRGAESMSLASISRMEAKLLLPTYERQPILFVRGRGVYLWDSRGKRYLDFLSGIGVNALGHNHPAIQATIRKQASRLIHVSNLFFHEYQAELAQMLAKISGLDRAFFCNSGTEAWEGALKLARAFAQMNNKNGGKANPQTRILAMENSFHGRTFGALATTGQPKYRAP